MSGAAARQDVAAGMNVREAEVTENQLLSWRVCHWLEERETVCVFECVRVRAWERKSERSSGRRACCQSDYYKWATHSWVTDCWANVRCYGVAVGQDERVPKCGREKSVQNYIWDTNFGGDVKINQLCGVFFVCMLFIYLLLKILFFIFVLPVRWAF